MCFLPFPFFFFFFALAEIFILAFAVVDSENEENWTWFLQLIRGILIPQGRVVTFISDRHPGLVQGVPNVFPESAHGYCLYHLKNNLRSRYPGRYGKMFRDKIVHLFTELAYAPTVAVYEEKLVEFLSEGREVATLFLQDLPKENFASAYFPGRRYGEMSNSLSESLNHMLNKIRQLPICDLVDGMRLKIMEMISEKRDAASRWNTVLCPRIEESMNLELRKGRHWRVSQCSESVFEVSADYSFVVNIAERTCTCRQWQVKGFPCIHGLRVAQSSGRSVYDLVEDFWKASFYRAAYMGSVVSVSTVEKPEDFSGDPVLAPITKRQVGRPRKNRFLSIGEVSKRPMKCTRCGKYARHNAKTCAAVLG